MLTERRAPKLHGAWSCCDRIIVTGRLPGACYAGATTGFPYPRGMRIFVYPKFAQPLRERIRERAQEVCAANGVSIEHVNKSHLRKQELVARVLAVRGDAPGLVHVLWAMQSCPSYKPWLDKSNGHIFLRGDTGKCLHCYFYFIDEAFGLCFLRVPTWAPFGLHSSIATPTARWRARSGVRASSSCRRTTPSCASSTELMFRSEQSLVPLDDAISRQAVLAADAPCVAGFLGQKITPALAAEIGSRLSTRIQGRCIKHRMGAAGVKVCDTFSRVLRIETTVTCLVPALP